jgi:DNA gyrase subunit A
MSQEFNHGKINPVNVSSEMKTSFLDYAMSVIVARALPDVRDGLKPVHRRILFAMNDLGIHSDKPYKKSARIAGEVIGKYHPHGEAAVYDTMVRMAQDFSYRYQLVDGHGNFGSIDGDGAAAMRYTEARLSKLSMEMMKDINRDTIDFVSNYDGEEQEPVVLPARFPNLLVNGSTGIAVGMATNIPPHNLKETINGLFMLMDNPDITIIELMEVLPGPDFPTGGQILGRSGIKQAYETGRGSVVIRSKTSIEDIEHGKKMIVVSEVPYQVNKANMVERIAQLVRDKVVEGIVDLRDLSNREGIRIEIELKRDIQAEVVLNQLFRMSQLQTSFGINLLSLVNNTPKQLNIKQILEHYLQHQIDVTLRRTRFDLNKAQERAHILEGLRIALDNIDEIISIIRSSKDDNETIEKFNIRFGLSEVQSKAILDMRLRRLTGLERDKIEDEYNKTMALITDLMDILNNHHRVLEIIKNELTDVRERFGDDRRTEIVEEMLDVMDEDLIPVSDIVVSLSVNGYIKRLAVDSYRSQNRGGRGIKGMALNIDDVVDQIITCSTHEDIMFFTNFGRVFRIRGYMVPEGSRIAKGIPVVNLLKLEKDEKVSSILSIPNDVESTYLFFCTKNGLVKRTHMDEFSSIRQSGKIAIGLNENDELIAVKLTNGDDEIIIAGSNGKAARFNEQDVRPMGRNAAGVKGFNPDGSQVVGMCTNNEGSFILSVTENGYGKKTPIDEYRLTSRGAKGVKTINTTDKNGSLITIKAVEGNEDIIIISSSGIVIRTAIDGISSQGRNAQGVKLIALDESSIVSNVAIIDKGDAEETDID